MAKYGKKAQRKVKKVMEEYKEGKLKSGSSGRKVKSRKQAIAIGLSEARREGDKVPKRKTKKKSASRKGTKKRTTKKSSSRKSSRKSSSRKSSRKSSSRKSSRKS